MDFKPFQAYTIENNTHTYGYTVYWPTSSRTKTLMGGVAGHIKLFYGWTFYTDDSGKITEHEKFGRQFIDFDDEEEIKKFQGYDPTERMEEQVMISIIKEIFEERTRQWRKTI